MFYELITEDILILLLLGAIAILLVWVLSFERRMRRLTRGSSGRNLESIIHEILGKTSLFEEHFKKVAGTIQHLDKRISKGMQGYGIVRFNAFSERGGNQSFSTAIVNEHGNGIILSSLFAHDRVALYVKPIERFASAHELTPEEKKALMEAREKIEN